MRDYDNPRPGSRAAITSALTTMTLRESRPTSISSFSDISASSTNIYSTHARRVRSVRKLRQILGPEDDTVERVNTTAEKELPLPPTTPLLYPFHSTPNDDPTVTSSSPTSDFASENEAGEKSTSLVYARLVKLEKLKRRFGEEVPKELVFFDQPNTLSCRGRSLSSPNVMNFAEKKDESFLGHIKNASSASTIPIANIPQAALRRSRARLGVWKSKSKKQPEDIEQADNGDDGGWMRIIKGGKGLDAEVVHDTSCPVRLTSLEGSDWGYISKANDRTFDVNFSDNAFMQSQLNTSNENSHVNLQGVQIVRSRSTLVIDRTSEDNDERMQVRSTVESSNKSMLSIIMDSPIDSSEQLLNSFYPLTLRRSHDETLGNSPSQTDPVHAPRKVRSAVALASKTRNPATNQPPLPSSVSHSETTHSREPSTPSPTSHSSYHMKETSWNDENIGLSSEDDRRIGRSISRGSKPKGPRPSSRSRPRTTDSSSITTPTTPSSGFRHSDEAVEHWQLLERQRKVPDSYNQESYKTVSPISKSRTLPSRHSLPPPPPPTKPSIPRSSDGSNEPPPPPSITSLTTLSTQKITPKTTGTVIYFYHRGVVRLAVDDGTRGPKTVQTVHMRDVLNYLRDMRYVH